MFLFLSSDDTYLSFGDDFKLGLKDDVRYKGSFDIPELVIADSSSIHFTSILARLKN